MEELSNNDLSFLTAVGLEIAILFSMLSTIIGRKTSQVFFVFVGSLWLLASLLFMEGDSYVNFGWIIFVLVLSTGLIVWGSFYLFEQRSRQDEVIPGDENYSLSMFVNILTFVIVCLELLIVLGSAFDKKYLNCSLIATGCIHKGTQVFIYHYKLRHLKARNDRLYGASWYFKLIALVNFILWNESIEVTTDDQTKYLELVFKNGYNIFATAHAALIIDYRLYCCILFIERAIEIDNQIKSNEANEQNEIEDEISEDLNKKIEHSSFEKYERFRNKIKTGKFLGCVIVVLQYLNTMKYIEYEKAIAPSNIIGCLGFVAFIFAGLWLLSKVFISYLTRAFFIY